LNWGLVHRAFGIELSLGSVIDLFAHPQSIAEVGFTTAEFVSTVIGAIAIAVLLAAISLALVSRVTQKTRGLWSVALLIAFLFIHLPVRAYCLYQIDRNQAAVLAYDDCVACPLRSETLIPHLRNTRFATADLASSESNLREYLFSGVQRRDGEQVSGDEWLGEVRSHLNEAAQMYEVCRTFHSHLENSRDRESFNQEALQLARSFPFFSSESS
jgi:hypothetical protein